MTIETYKGFIVEERLVALPSKRWNAHRIMEIAFFGPTKQDVLKAVDSYLRDNALETLEPVE